ncbi:manganese-dependent ADP-ribose/CDP-alcohol diphosphatase [Aplochiton taeniatus]
MDCSHPLFTFGVIADIQYADIDDGFNFKRTRKRYYRNSLNLLHNAQERWALLKPCFILQLGDIIDGVNQKYNASDQALETVLKEFSSNPSKVHHVWGNHEFYNFSRDTLLHSNLNSSSLCNQGGVHNTGAIYAYHFSPSPKFRFVVLDAYDVSLLGREESSAQYINALKLVKEHNHNEELNNPPVPFGLEQRFVKFNGGFSKDQLDWLDGILSLADEKLERVVIVSHLPVHPSSTDPICLAWNYDELLPILRCHRSVVCFMAGHDHDGGYYKDDLGVHFLTLEGVIETPPDSGAFGTVSVYEDRMVLKGNGRMFDREFIFP